jgi:hypothetical protein
MGLAMNPNFGTGAKTIGLLGFAGFHQETLSCLKYICVDFYRN